jgi:PilZ domain-containing protein
VCSADINTSDLFRDRIVSAQLNVKDKRRLKRFSVRLKVYSQQTDELLGYAENLHIQGMMIVSKKPITDKQELQIWFGASKDEKRLNRIFLSAYKVWNSFNDTEERLYYSGLHFVSPSEDTLDRIQSLLDELND